MAETPVHPSGWVRATIELMAETLVHPSEVEGGRGMAQEKRPFEETRAAWEEVGERLTEVGRRVREQYQRLGSEAKEVGAEAAEAAEEARRTSGEAIQEAIRRLDQAFTSVGETIRDPNSKEKLKEAGRSLAEALRATFTDAGEEARRRFGSKGGGEA